MNGGQIDAVTNALEQKDAEINQLRADNERLKADNHKLRVTLQIFADDENWRYGRRLDPNGSRFDGTTIASATLKDTKPRLRAERDGLRTDIERLTAEIELRTVGFTRFVQDSNDCPITGVFCRPECGCELEMKEWIKWTLPAPKDTKPHPQEQDVEDGM